MKNKIDCNILTFQTNKVSWQKLVSKGYYLKGAIKAAKGALCARCKHTSFSSVFDDFIGSNVPKCDKCQGPPGKLKLTKNIPCLDGGSVKKDYYRGLDGQPLTKIADALALLGKINEELEDGSFRPENHDHKSKERAKFENFANEYIELCNDRLKWPIGHEQYLSAGGHLKKVSLIKNELIPFFKDKPLGYIESLEIQRFARSYINKLRTRDLALGELKTMLRFAHGERLITHVPHFKRIPKARSRKSEEIPSIEMQTLIINTIDHVQYKAMWIIAATLAKRPCEVRAYKVCDIDLKAGLVYTRRHFTKGLTSGEELIDGRKSIGLDDELGSLVNKIDERMIEILRPFTENKKGDDFLFTGERGKYVCSTALWEAWRRACKKLEVSYQPYAGTKSSTATDMVRKGRSIEEVRALLGHKNSKQSETYAKIAAIDTKGMTITSEYEWCGGSVGVLQ